MYILYQVFCCWLIFGSPHTEKIIVDNENHQTINISSISEKSFPIKINKSLFNVKQVVVSDEFLFLAVQLTWSRWKLQKQVLLSTPLGLSR